MIAVLDERSNGAPAAADGVAAAGGVGPGPVARWLQSVVNLLSEETIVADDNTAETQRWKLRTLASQAAGLDADVAFERWMPELRTAQRDYRDWIEKRLKQLERDLTQTGAALQDAMLSVATQGEDEERRLGSEIEKLKTLRAKDSVEEIKSGLDQACSNLDHLIQNMQTQNHMLVAQLRDEIKTLQTRLETAERRQVSVPGNLSHRGFFERKIEARVAAGDTFSLYLVRVVHWKNLLTVLSQEKAQALSNDVSQRLARALGEETFAGRWYDGYFAALVSTGKRDAMSATNEIQHKVSGGYKLGTDAADKPVNVTVRDPSKAKDALSVVDTEMAKLASEGPTDDELKRARTTTLAAFTFGLEKMGSRANHINGYMHYTQNPNYLADDLGRYDAVSKDSVKRTKRSRPTHHSSATSAPWIACWSLGRDPSNLGSGGPTPRVSTVSVVPTND